MREKKTLPLKAIEGFQDTDPSQPLPNTHMSSQMRKEGHQALVMNLTKATQGRVTLDLGLPTARSAYWAD